MFTQPAFTDFVPLAESSHRDCEADNCKAPATIEITRRDPDEYARGEGGLYVTDRCDPHGHEYIRNIDGGMITFTVELNR